MLWLRDDVRPATQIGAQNWHATNVSVMASSPAGQGVFIAAHIHENNGGTDWPACYVGFNATHWWVGEQLTTLGTSANSSGPLPPAVSGEGSADHEGGMHWRKLELRLTDTGMTTYLIDGKVLHTGVCASAAGTAGLGSISYAPAFFDNFTVSAVAGGLPSPSPSPSPGPLPKPPQPEKCAAPKAGDPLLLLSCADTHTGHAWSMGTDGKLQLKGTELCLSIDQEREEGGAEAVCTTADDCQLNGVCTSGKCDCDAMWEGDNCERVALEGPGSLAYGGPQSNITSWGGGPPVYDAVKKEWVLFVTEIANHCGLSEWQHQSTVVKTVAVQPQGPYTRDKLAIPAQAHNPYYVFDPSTQTHLIYHIGTGSDSTPKVHCKDGTNPKGRNGITGDSSGSMEETGEVIYSAQPNLHASKSLDGPFEKVNFTLPAGHSPVSWGNDNPAPFVFDNGTVLMLTRKYNHTRAVKHIVPHDTIWLCVPPATICLSIHYVQPLESS